MISSIATSNSTSDAVFIDSGLGVIDGGDADTDIVADSPGAIVTVNATTGVGNFNPLDIEVNSIRVENTTVGDINLIEGMFGGDISILSLDNGAANGNIRVETVDGTISVFSDGGTGIVANSGTVILDAFGAFNSVFLNNGITAGAVSIDAVGDVVINAPIMTSGGSVAVDSGFDISFGANGDIISDNGPVIIFADFDADGRGTITMADGAVINAGGGTISLGADDDIILGGLVTTGTANVTTNAGEIIDGGDLNTDIQAATVSFNATNGIGNDDAIDLQAGSIDADNATAGDINLLQEAGDIDVVNLINNAAANGKSILLLKTEPSRLSMVTGGNRSS